MNDIASLFIIILGVTAVMYANIIRNGNKSLRHALRAASEQIDILTRQRDIEQRRADHLLSANRQHAEAANELLICHNLLEQRNAYLEKHNKYCQSAVAAAMLFVPRAMGDGEKMSIKERTESP